MRRRARRQPRTDPATLDVLRTALGGLSPLAKVRVQLARRTAARLRACSLCGARAHSTGVWVPGALRALLPDQDAKPLPYALCRTCGQLDQAALTAQLDAYARTKGRNG